MKLLTRFLVLALCLNVGTTAAQRLVRMADYGLKPNTQANVAPKIQKILQKIKKQYPSDEGLILEFEKGTYHFYEQGAVERVCYISNHDQTNPKKVGVLLDRMKNVILDGCGADFVFHGRMLPLMLHRSENCTLRNLSIDFANPHISQVKIVENNASQGIIFEPAPWVDYRITSDSLFETRGEGWTMQHRWGIAFEGESRHVVYQTSDVYFANEACREIAPRRIVAPHWQNERLVEGTVVALRGWERPAPGIFLDQAVDTHLERVTVHYAEGMGLLAQMCTDITLDGFNVSLRGADDPRYFTTQADATHFSGCRGKIISRNGFYEGMMDDAINVHGTYLLLTEKKDERTFVARYMHEQTWGFVWGFEGDRVQVVRSRTMENIGEENAIESIEAYDQDQVEGAHEFLIRFRDPLPHEVDVRQKFGIENLTWSPEVEFVRNTVRNNRARGALFSTPRKVLVESNIFDHTSGAAILLCGDCNGWYETGACRDVVIRKNRFINALTNLFQFTNAVISIYPEIPDLEHQKAYFHSGIVIEDNLFDTFDLPILYAKSVDGLIFRRNHIHRNQSYRPFHPIQTRIRLERVENVSIE